MMIYEKIIFKKIFKFKIAYKNYKYIQTFYFNQVFLQKIKYLFKFL